MQLFLICIILCYILFLYFLYKLGKEDFILSRKNIALEQLFNLTLITTLLSLFFGRLLYVAFNFHITYLNPLKFLVIPYFPGLLLPGMVVGAYLYLYFSYQRKKIPTGRLMDFYSTALLLIMPFLMLSETFLLPHRLFFTQVILALVYCIVFLVFHYVLMPRVSRGEIKSGTTGLIFLGIICTISFLQDSFVNKDGIISFLQPEDIFYLCILIFCVLLISFQEFMPARRRSRS